MSTRPTNPHAPSSPLRGAAGGSTTTTTKTQRRDATGHIDPQYARELLAKSGKSSNTHDYAFLTTARTTEELSEELGESFVQSATSGEEAAPERSDRMHEAERGGPYVITSDSQEFAVGVDASNPRSATREPFPRS